MRVPVPPVKRVTVDDLCPIRPPAAPEPDLADLFDAMAAALRRVAGQLDYLQSLWGKEGISDSIAREVRSVLARLDEPEGRP